jgi:hypothetical protein
MQTIGSSPSDAGLAATWGEQTRIKTKETSWGSGLTLQDIPINQQGVACLPQKQNMEHNAGKPANAQGHIHGTSFGM